jgi:hypothetical protein
MKLNLPETSRIGSSIPCGVNMDKLIGSIK